jgi:hypothetical protein
MRALLVLVGCSMVLVSAGVGASASVASLGGVTETLAGWRSHVGHGLVTAGQKQRLSLIARAAVRPTRATILRESVVGGSEGPAIYLDLVAQDPVWTLRHAHTLIEVVAKAPFSGGWAIRLRDARHVTVWIAGHAANEGFVGSASKAIDAASPVAHGQPVTSH